MPLRPGGRNRQPGEGTFLLLLIWLVQILHAMIGHSSLPQSGCNQSSSWKCSGLSHLQGIRPCQEMDGEDFGAVTASMGSRWSCFLGASAARACALLTHANKSAQKVSLLGKSLKCDSYFKCIPMGTLVLNYARSSETNESH